MISNPKYFISKGKFNPRKEHFNISPQEVEKVLKEEYNINVDFTYEPFDEEFEFSKNNS